MAKSRKHAVTPLAVTKQRAFEIIGMPKVVQTWLYWTRRAEKNSDKWLVIAREGGRGTETVIDYASLYAAYQRYLAGDRPPPMPSDAGGAPGPQQSRGKKCTPRRARNHLAPPAQIQEVVS